MKQENGNILTMFCNAVCITTNGFVKRNGECVMGRGIAKQIKSYIPQISYDLGHLINTQDNKVHLIYPETDTKPAILSYPVKPISKVCTSPNDYVSHMHFDTGSIIPGWACKADINIIEQSAYQLLELANNHDWERIILPRVGCGAGELDWLTVEPILSDILDDRFVAVTY